MSDHAWLSRVERVITTQTIYHCIKRNLYFTVLILNSTKLPTLHLNDNYNLTN